jgi:hypothetical protein
MCKPDETTPQQPDDLASHFAWRFHGTLRISSHKRRSKDGHHSELSESVKRILVRMPSVSHEIPRNQMVLVNLPSPPSNLSAVACQTAQGTGRKRRG